MCASIVFFLALVATASAVPHAETSHNGKTNTCDDGSCEEEGGLTTSLLQTTFQEGTKDAANQALETEVNQELSNRMQNNVNESSNIEHSLNKKNPPPPINCQWGSWNGWGACPVTCGGSSQTTQSRVKSVAVSPNYGGLGCGWTPTESQVCGTQGCPVNCQWSSWNGWQQCSVSCGGGQQSRSRYNSPAQAYGGSACVGASS